MNTLLECTTAVLIMWCAGPLALGGTSYFLAKYRKRSLLTDALSAGVAFFVISFLFVLTDLDHKSGAKDAYDWLVPPAVGIITFLISLVSLNVRYHIFLGYKTYDDYVQGEAQKAAQWAAESQKRADYLKDWKQHLQEWARRMWSGWYP